MKFFPTIAGKGTADISYDLASNALNWKVTYSSLNGPATAAHFHGPAEPGKNAPVIIPFTEASSGAEGSTTLTDVQAADLLSSKFYVNVHTVALPGGEIRAQVTKSARHSMLERSASSGEDDLYFSQCGWNDTKSPVFSRAQLNLLASAIVPTSRAIALDRFDGQAGVVRSLRASVRTLHITSQKACMRRSSH